MSIFKLWSSAGRVYKGSEQFQPDSPPKQTYVAPLALDQDVAALQDFRNHIPSPRLVKADTFKRILNDLFAHPLILHAFLKNDGEVVCMDGGIVGNHLHMASPGFYYLARHMEFHVIRLIKYYRDYVLRRETRFHCHTI